MEWSLGAFAFACPVLERYGRVSILGLLLVVGATAVGCHHPKSLRRLELAPRVLLPSVVETSASGAPGWLSAQGPRGIGQFRFVGEGRASSLEEARRASRRDLLSAISTFISVDVSSEMVERVIHDAGIEVVEIRAGTVTQSEASLTGLRIDRSYWARYATPMTPLLSSYQYYVRAEIAESEVARVRVHKQLAREQQTGRKVVVLLPFSAGFSGQAAERPQVFGGALVEYLAANLAHSPDLHVADVEIVRSLAIDPQDDAWTAIGRIQDGLLPDFIIQGSYQEHEARLRLSAALYDGRTGAVINSFAAHGAQGTLLAVADRLLDSLAESLGVLESAASRTQTPAPAARVAAFEAYSRAYASFERGANEDALEELRRALDSERSARVLLRMGHVLERMGRYGRIPPSSAAPTTGAKLLACTTRGRKAVLRAEIALEERAQKLVRADGGPKWWTPETRSVDDVLTLATQAPLPESAPYRGVAAGEGSCRYSACPVGWHCDPLTFQCRAGYENSLEPARPGMSRPYEPPMAVESPLVMPIPDDFEPTSAIEAYYLALQFARRHQDVDAEINAGLAIADLAVRVDRPAAANAFYTAIASYGTETRNAHLVSLAYLGMARVRRRIGQTEQAISMLDVALSARLQLGEKPYLLEIHNERGGTLLDLGRYADAKDAFTIVERLATELRQDYLRTVARNNIGVLEEIAGDGRASAAAFADAYGVLSDLGEAEGRLSSGMNHLFARAREGDVGRAQAIIDELDAVVESTTQERRLAELRAHAGLLAFRAGDIENALFAFASSWTLLSRLQLGKDALRQQNNFLAVELSAPSSQGARSCIQSSYWQLGTPAFFPAPYLFGDDPRTIEQLPVGSLGRAEIVRTLNASAGGALSAWSPPDARPAEPADERAVQLDTRLPDRFPEPSARPEPPIRPRAEQEPGPMQEDAPRGPYERILDAFTLSPDVAVLLNPREVQDLRSIRSLWSACRLLDAVVKHLEAMADTRLLATALVDRGGVRWFHGDAEEAYADIMRAQGLFAGLGDLHGLAHVHEWLGFFLAKSGASERAIENFEASFGLFELLGDASARSRVRAYVE